MKNAVFAASAGTKICKFLFFVVSLHRLPKSRKPLPTSKAEASRRQVGVKAYFTREMRLAGVALLMEGGRGYPVRRYPWRHTVARCHSRGSMWRAHPQCGDISGAPLACHPRHCFTMKIRTHRKCEVMRGRHRLAGILYPTMIQQSTTDSNAWGLSEYRLKSRHRHRGNRCF